MYNKRSDLIKLQPMIKIKKPIQIQATYKIITPMFIGDANKKATGISPQSFKGALRFWWRALAWSRIYKEKPGEVEALKELHRQEAVLFGSSAINPKTKEIYGKGLITLKIIEQPKKLSNKVTSWPDNSPNSPSTYLAFGITESGDKARGNYAPHREGISEFENYFTVELNQKNADGIIKNQIEDVLKIMGLVAGLGSRSRRGFGSIQLVNLNDKEIKLDDINDYCDQLSQFLNVNIKEASYTAISQNSDFACIKGGNDARTTHAKISRIYKNHHNHNNTGDKEKDRREKNKKKVFGLPLPAVDKNARRASPLFFHVLQTQTGFYCCVLYLPSSIFHKDKEHQEVDYSLLTNFLNDVRESNNVR